MGRDFDDDDFFDNYKRVHSENSAYYEYSSRYRMNWVVAVMVVVGAVVLLALLCRCCCRKSRGRVLAPPTDNITTQAPYPQQQYAAPYIAAVPVLHAAAPSAAPYYPVQHAAPLHAAAVSPYPAAGGAPYPAGPPYPAHDPYPQPQPAGYPHPQPGAYPHPQPQPNAPTDVCPPSYEQVMGAGEKQPPYNPHMPH